MTDDPLLAFSVRLSLALGIPLSELHLSPDELAIYLAFESRYGILGPQRFDLQNGNIVATLCNLYRSKAASAIKPTEAMLPMWDELPAFQAIQSEEEIRRQLSGLEAPATSIKDAIAQAKRRSLPSEP